MSDPKIAELIAMGEKARAELETGNYIRGVQSEIDFRAAVAAWFRETYTKERA